MDLIIQKPKLMDLGYIKLHRKIHHCKALQEPGKVWSKFEAWIDIIMRLANGIDDGSVKRGEFVASYRYMAKAWRWDVHKTYRFINTLISEGMLEKVQHPAQHPAQQDAQHLKISNYEIYNPISNTHDNTNDNTKRNKIKECLKESKRIKDSLQPADAAAVDPLPSVESIQLSEKLRQAIQVRDPIAKAGRLPDTTHWARDIDKLICIDGRRAEDIEAVIMWCQRKDCFWGPNILSGRKLREKFDTLFGQMLIQKHNHAAKNGKHPDLYVGMSNGTSINPEEVRKKYANFILAKPAEKRNPDEIAFLNAFERRSIHHIGQAETG
jgi:hypothetical protein